MCGVQKLCFFSWTTISKNIIRGSARLQGQSDFIGQLDDTFLYVIYKKKKVKLNSFTVYKSSVSSLVILKASARDFRVVKRALDSLSFSASWSQCEK